MARFKPSVLLIGASVVAVTAGILVACAHDKGGQVADASGAVIPDRPDWNWDVRPILSQNCFACHGQGTQKAGLRLDIEKAAYDPIPEDKNKRAIVPGNTGKSELYRRITSTDSDYRMPPRESHKTLSPRDISILERWIKQGAQYKQHWAYITPTIVKPERTKWDGQAVNEIDRYIYAKLAKEGLTPSPEADRETLINNDWKVTSPDNLKKYRRDGPGRQYRIQAHLYALGMQLAGEKPEHVAITFLPRGGRIDGLWVWTEPYQPQIAVDALRHYQATCTALGILIPDAAPDRWAIFPTADAHCLWCPWHLPASTDLSKGCPGHGTAPGNTTTKEK